MEKTNAERVLPFKWADPTRTRLVNSTMGFWIPVYTPKKKNHSLAMYVVIAPTLPKLNCREVGAAKWSVFTRAVAIVVLMDDEKAVFFGEWIRVSFGK